MENTVVSGEKDTLVSSFLGIVVGQSAQTAIQFLEATGWNLEEAIRLFYAGLQDNVRPPLPVKREKLCDESDHPMPRNHSNVWESGRSHSSDLASLYRPPVELLYQGTFHEAKGEASLQNKWLLVNVQSAKDFSSHLLNRDTWANESVAQMITISFVFLQVYDDSHEGLKICNFYALGSVPAVLVIDPITGQMMRSWSGVVEAETLLMDLVHFMDYGPNNYPPSLVYKRKARSHQSLVYSQETEVAKHEEMMLASTETETSLIEKTIYPPLPGEPKCEKSLLCRVAVRFPDGRRVQRNFLRKDPIQLLWSFCYSQLEETGARPFRLVQAIPGDSKQLDYATELTFEESGINNSMILVDWIEN
ncbi:PREDICTED: plant UBX domain-containing protein 7-like [Nelumbo nucifera]|uniref:Plant UBX domain-containing protein 7-like n=2 Tax=Nelumbo nucifera TaxID=4432 RepID=A0A1U7ZXU1_NELNU|nr:PREDICTED: plant UBX domain-containing protein 7-like [Nelumbo nucifera]DAD35806.1 TPA_asm: hypothetical protein HUJ06_006446 [Nelumbo nucifera]